MKIKNLLLLSLIVIAITACNNEGNTNEGDSEVSTDIINDPATASDEAVNKDLPIIEFEEEVMDFGEISQGEKVKRIYKFTNVGKSDLIISDAKGSCGCTVPRWPKQPIKPGQQGDIEVVFDSNGKQGRQHKTVTLIANTKPNTTIIALKGDVLVPEK
jgi:hypothetical protein